MTLTSVLVKLVTVELLAIGVAVPLVVGRDRLRTTHGAVRRRLGSVLPYLVALGLILLLNKVARTIGPDLSWMIGWNVTTYIHGLEGSLVASVQSLASPPLTAYFSTVYVYGYVFILVFPLLAYFFHPNDRWLRRLVVAYGVNYGVGLCCYLLFVAYGPRNLLPNHVEPLLYATQPSMQLLTTEINANTNVFPSLHTSLATTVALLSYRTRETYPRWYYVATVLAGSVALSTMYLGIHWGTDVVAGMILAFGSVRVARRVVPDVENERSRITDAFSPIAPRYGR